MKKLRLFLFLVAVLCLAVPVMAADKAPEAKAAATPHSIVPACPDYSKDNTWSRKPAKPDKPVDVFYIYPTIYSDVSPENMDIKNKTLRASADHLMTAQAGVYSPSANLFAPYYRQMTIAALNPKEDLFHNQYFRIGADDIQRAFNYYLANLSDGRPFILAGHSQGSQVLLDLLRQRFFEPALQKRLVAAYIIGYSVTPDDLKKYPWLKIAQKADDTGVIITFNTQAPGATGSPVLHPGAACVNPLSWTTGQEMADKSLNLGAVFYNDTTDKIEREVPGYVGCRCNPESNALEANPPDKLEVGDFPAGVYHRFDYALWYRNLEKNVATRVAAYLKANPQK